MIILVGGLPGAGKTYLASRLSRKLGLTYISSDGMRKQMDAQGHYVFEDRLNVYEEMARCAADELRRGNAVLVDATFYSRQFRQLFCTLARLMHERCVFIEVVADEGLIARRLSQPRKSGQADLSVYRLVKALYEEVDIPHLVVESKDNNVEAMIARATDHILQS